MEHVALVDRTWLSTNSPTVDHLLLLLSAQISMIVFNKSMFCTAILHYLRIYFIYLFVSGCGWGSKCGQRTRPNHASVSTHGY